MSSKKPKQPLVVDNSKVIQKLETAISSFEYRLAQAVESKTYYERMVKTVKPEFQGPHLESVAYYTEVITTVTSQLASAHQSLNQ